MILGVEGADVAIGQGHVEQAEQPGVLPQIEPCVGSDRSGNPIPLQRGALNPEQGDLGLLGGAGAGSGDVIATQTLHLVEVCGVLLPGHSVRRTRAELRAVAQDKGGDIGPSRREREVEPRCEAVLTRLRALRICRVEQWCVRPVPGPQGQDGRGSGLSQGNTLPLASTVRDCPKRGRIGIIHTLDRGAGGDAIREGRRELLEEWDQYVSRRRSHSSLGRGSWFRSSLEDVGTRATVDRVQRVVDGHVHGGIEPRFVERVVRRSKARVQRGLAGIRIPDGDGIHPRGAGTRRSYN